MKQILLLWMLSLPIHFAFCQEKSSDESKELPARVYFKDGKLNFATENDRFRLWLDNRIYIDAACYFPSTGIDGLASKPNKDLETDDGIFRFNNGVSIRRARFALKAELYKKWFAEFDLDFAYNEVEIKDMYLGYKFNDRLSIQVGHFKEPMSMERLTSSKYLTGMERPMAIEMFAGGRRLGIAATLWGNHWWASGGIFGQQVDIIQKEKNRGSDGYGLTGRIAVSPVVNNNLTVHIGGYATYRTPDAAGSDDRLVEFRTFPESRTDRRRYVRTEIPNVNHYATYGFETAIRWNKLLAYGEYLFTDLSRYKKDTDDHKVSLKNATFNGWYATASYMLIGSQRQYAPEDAEFGPMQVNPRGGNLEIAARVSTVNLNDFHDASAIITGGKANAYSASLNWFPVKNVLIGLHYTYMDHDKYADDKGHITKDGKPLSQTVKQGIDFSILQMRVLVSF
ncbi:MAG: OprO/OprP family phosphate-selective porin [Odoribacter splanchnicus]